MNNQTMLNALRPAVIRECFVMSCGLAINNRTESATYGYHHDKNTLGIDLAK